MSNITQTKSWESWHHSGVKAGDKKIFVCWDRARGAFALDWAVGSPGTVRDELDRLRTISPGQVADILPVLLLADAHDWELTWGGEI